jgi:hypothetical protein
MLHSAGVLQRDGWPSRFQIRTFQKQRFRDANGCPAYSTSADSWEGTRPLFQRSPFSAPSDSLLEATRT